MAHPNPAADLRDHLAARGPYRIGKRDLALEQGRNLFSSPELATSAEVQDCAVFVQNQQGQAPEPYYGNASDFIRYQATALVRSEVNEFGNGEQLARLIVARMHRSAPSGYVACVAAQGLPAYQGSDDSGRFRWLINFELWWSGSP